MIAALATLVFLATIVALFAIGALILEESGVKILAALRGASDTAPPARVALRVSPRALVRRPVRVQPRLRAAA